MYTVFEAQSTYTPNWVLLIFSLLFLICGGCLLKRRIAVYEKITQLLSSILLIFIGLAGLIFFACLHYFKQTTPQLVTPAVFLLLLPLVGFFDTKEPNRFLDFFKADTVFALIIAILFTLASGMVTDTIIGNIKLKAFIIDTYQKGNALTVEGEIENFHPMPEDLHDTESFTVDGVEFYYGSHNQEYFYSKCAFEGGYIKHNGQKVKLWYVVYNEENYIVRVDLSLN